MRGFLIGVLVLLAVLVGGVAWLGTVIEERMNRVEGPAPAEPSAEAVALHRAAPVVDLHADPLLWGRDLRQRSAVGHVDLPRLRDGGVAVQVFGLVTKFPVTANVTRTDPRWPDAITLLALAHRWPWATVRSLRARALHQAARLAAYAADPDANVRLIRTRADLDQVLAARAAGEDVLGALLGVEGAHALEGDPRNVRVMFEAGVRMIGLAHFFDNAFAGSAHGLEQGGLTERGITLVTELDRRGMVLDLAHASAAAITDALEVVEHPPVVSHTGVRGTCDTPRNLTDEQVRAVAAKGGVIGIGIWETAVCGLSPDHVARAARHVADLVGVAHVGIGTDFDGAVATGFDASRLAVITQALLDADFTPSDVQAVLGGNALRVLRAVLPAG